MRASIAFLVMVAALHSHTRQARADGDALLGYPTTDIVDKGDFHLDVDTLGQGLKFDAYRSIGLTYGLGPGKDGLFGRTEVGVDFLMPPIGSGFVSDSVKRLFFNVETQLYNNSKKGVRVAAGAYGIGSTAIGSPNMAYVLGSKIFPWGKLQLGLAHSFANKASLITPAGKDNRNHIQVSFSRNLTGRLFGAATTYMGHSTQSRTGVGVAYFLNNSYKSSVSAAVIHHNDASMSVVLPSRNLVYLGYDQRF